MEGKNIFILIIIIISLLLSFFVVLKTRHVSFIVSKETPELNLLIPPSIIKNWNEKSSIPFNKAMINIIHITKHDGTYSISCEYGPSYQDSDPFNPKYSVVYSFNNSFPVYFRRVRNCTTEAAQLIDDWVEGKGNPCVGLNDPFTPQGVHIDLTDYYVVLLLHKFEYLNQPVNFTRQCPPYTPVEMTVNVSVETERYIVDANTMIVYV